MIAPRTALPSTVAGPASVLFWGSLGALGLLLACLSLAGRFRESEQLRLRFMANAQRIERLEREIVHLERLETALRTDPDFVARVAASEFGRPETAAGSLPIAPHLQYDARAAAPASPTNSVVATAWYSAALEAVATSHSLRQRLALACGALTLLAFGCCTNAFLTGGAARSLSGIGAAVKRRYVAAETHDEGMKERE